MTPRAQRVVVVLGYSDGGTGTLHPVCSARLRQAAAVARPDDVVVLSGWARVPGSTSEAELMAAAWTGAAAELVVDPVARTTVENALNACDDILRVAVGEVVVVTSSWHAPRATAALRWLLRGRGISVTASSPPEPRRVRATLREVPLWALLPVQLWHAGRSRSRAGGVAARATATPTPTAPPLRRERT